MSNYINQVSDSLKNHISELANNPCLFLRNPNVDFSRKRKIDFKTFIGIMMNSGGATMSKELLDFFDFNKNTPSVSAFTQQRSKVLPEAFEYLFKSFTDDNLPTTNNYHGYRLIACDGSNLTIATNQKDPETFWERNQHGSIVNKLHLNAFYDVLNRIYTDVLVQTAADYNEFRACATMIDRSKLENVILVADRGYENYNIFAHAIEKGWKFAIRVKDKNSNGIASGLNLPPNDEFDIDITQIFSRKNTKTTKNAGYKWMPVNQVFDYLPRKSDKTYELSFRIIRFPIGSNSYEIIITNLDRNIFDVKKINNPIAELFDVSKQNIEILKENIYSSYKGKTITAFELFEEHQITGNYCRSQYAKALRELVEENRIKSKFTDGKNHIVSVLISKNCIIEFK